MASYSNEATALESPGPGGMLHWKEHLSGSWSAKGLGGRYDIYPRGAGGYTAYWEQSGTGAQHEIGSYDTIGAAFAACRRHADGERRQTAAAEASGDVSKDVARKAAASAYGAGQIETVTGSGNRFTVTLKSGKRLHVAVDGSTGTVTDPDDGHVVATHTVSEARPAKDVRISWSGASRRSGDRTWTGNPSDRSGQYIVQGLTDSGFDAWFFPRGSKSPVLLGHHSTEELARTASLRHARGGEAAEDCGCAHKHPKSVPTKPCASETVPVIHEANDAGAFATMDRDTTELAKGKKLGKACTPQEIYKLVRGPLEKESQEVFLVIPLDLHGELISRPVEVARGQRDRVSIGISDVMRPVAQTNAKGFVVVHNHPSGHARPSPKDRELTETIKKHTFPDVTFLDHIVVGSSQFYSFTENKLYKVR